MRQRRLFSNLPEGPYKGGKLTARQRFGFHLGHYLEITLDQQETREDDGGEIIHQEAWEGYL